MCKDFVHLNLHSEYTLSCGVSSIDSYLKKANEMGMKAIALTDTHNMFGAIEFYKKAKAVNIKPIVGAEISVYEEKNENNKNPYNLILLAKNYDGYKNLIKIISESYKNNFRSLPKVDKEFLKKFSGELIAICCFNGGEVTEAILDRKSNEEIEKIIYEYVSIFGKKNFYIEVQASEIDIHKQLNDILYEYSLKTQVSLVATNNVHYLEKEDKELQDIVFCIFNNIKISDSIATRNKNRSKTEYLKSAEEMEFYLGAKFRDAIENTNKISEECNLEIEFGKFQFPNYEVPKDYENIDEYLKNICYSNLKNLYGEEIDKKVIERLEYELKIISQMGYSGYFVIVWDFINYARKQNILVGPGRGSAAGSIVAYCLGITKVDPLKYNLLFERFLNPERISMPDIDIDVCAERREEIIDYIVEKYGRDRVAHIITFGRMKAKAAIRDVGRVFNVSLKKIDSLTKKIEYNQELKECIEENDEIKKIYTSDIEIRKVLDFAIRLENRVRNISTHAAGILISEKKLDEIIPVYLESENSIYLTQYQMKEIEELGLLKMDILGLKNLTNIQKTIDYINREKIEKINLYKIPLDDEKVYKLLSSGETSGIFQLESAGAINLAKKMKPNKFEEIVALVSLQRPGPLKSGMVDSFINSKNGLSEIIYPDDSLKEILKETYGLILYQEQVMKIASLMADYSMGEADLLRRAMGKKNIELMQKNKDKFVLRAIQNGYTKEKAEEIFFLIDKFAGYGFNKSHSVVYALVAYWTMYLKVNFPEYYYAALLSSEISSIEKIEKYIADIRKANISFLTPDINNPYADFEVKDGKITFSLAAIKNMGMTISENIVREFNKNGKFLNYENFVQRLKNEGLNKKNLEALIYSGALDCLKGNRKEKILSVDKILDFTSKKMPLDEIQQMNLFGAANRVIDSFNMEKSEDYDLATKLMREKEFLGFYLSSHPLDNYSDLVSVMDLKNISDILLESSEMEIETFGEIKDIKNIFTKDSKQMCTFNLEFEGEKIRCVIFPKIFSKDIEKIRDKNNIYIKGKFILNKYNGIEKRQINVEKIIELNNLLEKENLRLYLLILEEDRSKYSRLKKILEKNVDIKGNIELNFAFNKNGIKSLRKTNRKLRISLGDLKGYIELLGKEKIKIKLM